MRRFLHLGLILLCSAIPIAAQNVCSAAMVASAADAVNATRRHLLRASIRNTRSDIPPAIATLLLQLKDALAETASAAFSCASPDTTPETLGKTLADTLHANLAEPQSSAPAFGADLEVQVFQLSSQPKFFQVTFRYGLSCGDDNLLLVYQATRNSAAETAWQPRLRWDARSYRTVGDAFGDFALLTPITGNDQAPIWRFVAAHGHPSCTEGPHPSRFDQDLLTPTTDPAKPNINWHYSAAYPQGSTTPRLATTENTVELRFTPTEKQEPSPRTYAFQMTPDGQITPKPSNPSTTDR